MTWADIIKLFPTNCDPSSGPIANSCSRPRRAVQTTPSAKPTSRTVAHQDHEVSSESALVRKRSVKRKGRKDKPASAFSETGGENISRQKAGSKRAKSTPIGPLVISKKIQIEDKVEASLNTDVKLVPDFLSVVDEDIPLPPPKRRTCIKVPLFKFYGADRIAM